MRCYGCIFKFSKNQRKRHLCYVNLMYQVSTFYSEKSLCNQKVHLRFLKSNVTYTILIAITFVVLHIGKWDFQNLPNQIYVFPGKTWSSIFYEVKRPRNVSITYNIFDCVLIRISPDAFKIVSITL